MLPVPRVLAWNEPSLWGFALRAMTVRIAKLSFWGVRGSTPTVDPATWRYGGNTPCLELIAPDGTQFILDCGTGLRMLGSRWAAPNGGKAPETHILVTHYHWDHIQGIPFFSPLYVENNEFHFYSFRSKFLGRDSLKQVFEAQMARPYFSTMRNSRRNSWRRRGKDGGTRRGWKECAWRAKQEQRRWCSFIMTRIPRIAWLIC